MSIAAERRADPAPEPPAAVAPHRPDRRAVIALALMLLAGLALLLYLGRDTTFYFDEWDWVQHRRDWTFGTLLEPHNEHLSVVPILFYKLLFATVGIDHYWPYRVLGLTMHALVVAGLFFYARRRVGDVLALAAAATILFLGKGWNDVLWPFQAGFMASMAAGVGALLALDRGTRRGDALAAALLLIALASSSLGLPLAAALALEVLGRPDRRARWWIVAAPVALYAVWWAGYGREGVATLDNLFATPAYVMEAFAGAAAAVVGLGLEWGRILAVVGVIVLLGALRVRVGMTWRLAALIALPLLFWALTGLARADLNEPAASRYLYPGALFLLLIAIEAGAGARLSRRGLAVLAPLLLGALIANVGAMRDGAGFLRDRAAELEGGLAATRLAQQGLSPSFQPEPQIAPQIRADFYLAAVTDLGSPVPPPSALPTLFQSSRMHADATLARAYNLQLGPGAKPGGSAPKVEFSDRAGLVARGPCVAITAQSPGAVAELVLPPGGLTVVPDNGDAKVTLRRFADGYGGPKLGAVARGAGPTAVRIRADASGVPWRARLEVDGVVRACGVAAG
ncbi:MAG: hypothetical protein QOC68_950 [Solirubrobacteraceae bacterium]|nr:hypothetical protein [Solirubrobacteraceae bacterium]